MYYLPFDRLMGLWIINEFLKFNISLSLLRVYFLMWHIEEAYCFAAFVITVFRSSYVRKGEYNCAEKAISKKLNGPSDTLLRKWQHSGMSVGQSRFVVSVKFK